MKVGDKVRIVSLRGLIGYDSFLGRTGVIYGIRQDVYDIATSDHKTLSFKKQDLQLVEPEVPTKPKVKRIKVFQRGDDIPINAKFIHVKFGGCSGDDYYYEVEEEE